MLLFPFPCKFIYMPVAPGPETWSALPVYHVRNAHYFHHFFIYLFWKADKIAVLMWIQHQLKYIGGQRFSGQVIHISCYLATMFYIIDMNMNISISIYSLDKLKISFCWVLIGHHASEWNSCVIAFFGTWSIK